MDEKPCRRLFTEQMAASDGPEYFYLQYPMPMSKEEEKIFYDWIALIKNKVSRINDEQKDAPQPEKVKDE